MPQYRLGSTTFRRKNFYMPCILGPRFEDATPDEQAQMFKATWWADLITEAEWKALLHEPDCSPSAKSRLKKKASGWMVALGRISVLDPLLYNEIYSQAKRIYEEQVGEKHPVLHYDET